MAQDQTTNGNSGGLKAGNGAKYLENPTGYSKAVYGHNDSILVGEGDSLKHWEVTKDIVKLAQEHPFTNDQLVAAGKALNEDRASRKTATMEKKGKLKVVGLIQVKHTGRPKKLFATRAIKIDQAEHEWRITWIRVSYPEAEFLRGTAVDPQYRADAEMTLEERYMIEIDCGTESAKQLKKRYQVYAAYEGFVLWIAPDVKRREFMRKQAEPVAHNALFSTLPGVIEAPFGNHWLDYYGPSASIR